ncbi:MAG: hypothetical protein IPK58_17225 [Acidobacteria bacterium]|nr:hypothetical protein [Acidobacteriota bacterium]
MILHFAKSEFLQGLCESVALVFLVTVGLITYERFRANAALLMFFAFLWCGPEVWDMIVILFRCDYVLHPTLARVGWSTLGEFLDDPLLFYGRFAVMATSFAVFVLYNVVYRRRQKETGTTSVNHE